MISNKHKLLYKAELNPPEWVIPWINHQDSLTDKLMLMTGDIHLKLLNQEWCRPTWWDQYVLHQQETIFQREIIMESRGLSCWYARSIIPLKCYLLNPCFFSSSLTFLINLSL